MSGPWWDICLMAVGLVALVVGAEWLVRDMPVLALVSLTVIALGTSLPELATSIVAVVCRQGDIILGNAIGSCIFNLLLVLGATALVKRMVINDVQPFDLAMMVCMVVLVVPLMWIRKWLGRPEGGAVDGDLPWVLCLLVV